MNKTLKKKPDFRVSNNIFSEKGKLWEFCYIKYFNLRKSVNLKILKRVTLKLDKCYQAVVLILPWNVICHFKRPVVFWAMYVSAFGTKPKRQQAGFRSRTPQFMCYLGLGRGISGFGWFEKSGRLHTIFLKGI